MKDLLTKEQITLIAKLDDSATLEALKVLTQDRVSELEQSALMATPTDNPRTDTYQMGLRHGEVTGLNAINGYISEAINLLEKQDETSKE